MKKTAKVLSIVLAISMVIGVTVALVFSAFAVDAPKLEVKQASKDGKTIVVNIDLTEGSFNSLDLAFEMDGVKCTSIVQGAAASGSMFVANPNAGAGTSNISMITMGTLSAGTIAVVTLETTGEDYSFEVVATSCSVTDSSSGSVENVDVKPSISGSVVPETTEAPSTEEPSTEEPSTEEPTTEEPTTEEPTTEEPTTEEPTTEEPTTEEPSTEEPTTEEPTTEEPTTEEPTTEEPTTEEPTTEEPTTEEPSTDAPAADEEPSTDAPATDEEPSTDAPAADEEPSTDAPAADEDATTATPEADTANPVTGESVVTAVAAVAVLGISAAAVVALRKKED